MNLFLYLVLNTVINYLPTKSEEIYIRIKSDGTLKNISATPTCKSGQKLSLNEYHYITIKGYGEFSSRAQNPFSVDAEHVLHSMCSFKEACLNLSFPVKSDLQNYKPDGVLMKYDCFDQTEEFCDLCSQTKLDINDTVNLMVSKSARHYRQCKCLLDCEKGGNISITLKDLRLVSYETLDDRKCSDAVLEINKTKLECYKNRTDLGNIFNKKLSPPVSSTSITFTQKEENRTLEMIWLVLKVKGNARMECEGEQKQRKSASETTSISENEVPSNQSAEKNTEPLSDLPGSVYTICIGVTMMVIALSVVVISLIYKRLRRKNTHSNKPQKGCSAEELLDDTTYDTCNKFSRTAPQTYLNDTYDHLPKNKVEMTSYTY